MSTSGLVRLTVGLAAFIGVFLTDCHGADPLTSRVTLTHNVTFSPYGFRDRIWVTSMLPLPSGQLLVATEGMRVKLISMNASEAVSLDEVPGDILALALIQGEGGAVVAMARRNLVYIVDLRGDTARVVKSYTIPDREYSCCFVVGSNTDPDTFLVAGYDHLQRGAFISVVSRDGHVLRNVVEGLEFIVDYMTVNDGDVYLSGMNLDSSGPSLMRVSIGTGAVIPNIGVVTLADFGPDLTFYQGSFDDNGNLYIALVNATAPDERACQCVLIITPEGNQRVIVPSDLPDNAHYSIHAVVATQSGFAVAWEMRQYFRQGRALIRFYSML